jgi:hypothetical protein
VRLCLDEHYSPEIACLLRDQRGHDVSAVKERPELIGLPDAQLVAAMRAERAALLTENVQDFMPIAQALAARGEDHWGFVFTSGRSMPRGAATIGRYVDVLDPFLSERPGEDDLKNQTWWL